MAQTQVLIVEDESIVAIDIQKGLKSLGYAVPAIAFSGEEAIQKTAEIHPDVVLIDIFVKGEIDGVEAAGQIRTRFDIPVVYLTAYTDEGTLQRAKITEPYGYIVKPFEERELHTTIEIALYKHKMERKIKESERWLATTLRSIGDAVIATDTKGLVTFMNPVAAALTGWRQEDALGKDVTKVFTIIDQETRTVAEGPVRKALREGVVSRLANHILLIAKDGAEIPIDSSAAPIKDDKGDTTGVVLVFQDITERKRAEEELRGTQEYAQNLIDSSLDMIISVDQDRRIVEFNRAAQKAFGYSGEEVLGKYVDILYADPAEGLQVHEEVRRTGRFIGEITNKRKDGVTFPSFLAASILRDARDEFLGVMGISRDISEQKRAQREMERRQKELSALCSITIAAHRSLDPKEVYELALDTVMEVADLDIIGIYLVDEVANEAVLVAHRGYPEDYVRRAGRIPYPKGVTWKIIDSGEIFMTPNVHTDPALGQAGRDLGPHPMLSVPIRLEERAMGVIHFVGRKDLPFSPEEAEMLISIGSQIGTAVTKAKLHEQICQTRDFLASLLESSPDAIVATDQEGKVTFFSKGAEEIFGYRAEEIIGQPVQDYYVGRIDEARKIKSLITETGSLRNYETAFWTKAGRPVPISLSASFLRDKKGEVVGTLGVSSDITDRKLAEEERERLLAELEAKNRELESFVYTVSHDLKAPLVSLGGFSAALEQEFYDQLGEEGKHYLERIQANVVHMDTLIENLLDLSRIGQVIGPIEEIDVVALLRKIQKELAVELEKAGAEFVVQEPLPAIRADRGRIRQVFANLISNAIKFRNKEQPLRIEVGYQKERGFYRFHVADNGIGIAPPYQEQIFAPFQQLDAETEGVGIGLALVKKIVEHHGGRVWVESAEGEGATFYFTVPRARG